MKYTQIMVICLVISISNYNIRQFQREGNLDVIVGKSLSSWHNYVYRSVLNIFMWPQVRLFLSTFTVVYIEDWIIKNPSFSICLFHIRLHKSNKHGFLASTIFHTSSGDVSADINVSIHKGHGLYGMSNVLFLAIFCMIQTWLISYR